MPKVFKRNCNFCKNYYENSNKYFCCNKCKNLWRRNNTPIGIKSPYFKQLKSICKTCQSEFFYTPSNKRGLFCSRKCYYANKEFLKERGYIAISAQQKKGINISKLKDEKLLELWEIFKTTNKSLRSVFLPYGYKRVPPKRLKKILSEGEYDKYKNKNRVYCSGKISLYKKGSHYERKAKKELEKEGFLVVRSGGSKGTFDLWALNFTELKLIQIKATVTDSNFSKVAKEIESIKVPNFCKRELWIWRNRKGWDKKLI